MNKINDLLNSENFKNVIKNKNNKYSVEEIDLLKLVLIKNFQEKTFHSGIFEKYSNRTFSAIMTKINNDQGLKLLKKNNIGYPDPLKINIIQMNKMIKFMGKKYNFEINQLEENNEIEKVINAGIVSSLSLNPISTIYYGNLSVEDMNNLEFALKEELKNKEITENIMYNYYKESYNNNKKGIYVNNAPTGFGKSYGFSVFIIYNFLYNGIFSKNTKSVFYFTDLKRNVLSTYNDTYNGISKLCEKYKLNIEIKNFMLSKIMFVPSHTDIIKIFSDQENNIIFNILKENIDPKIIKDIISKIRKISEIKDNEVKNEKYIEIYREIKDICKKIYKDKTTSEKEKYILNFLFSGEKILQQKEPMIFFMSTHKAFSGLELIDGNIFINEIKDSLIFIDESDRQYNIIKNIYIDKLMSYDLIYHVNNIILALKNRKFKNNQEHSGEKIESVRKDFIDKFIVPFEKKFDINNSFSIEKDEEKEIFSVFENGITTLSIKGHNYITLEQRSSDNVNHLVVSKGRSKDKGKNIYDNDKKNGFTNLLNASSHLVQRFSYMMVKVAKLYKPLNKIREFTLMEKIAFLLDEISINNKLLLEIIKGYVFFNMSTFDSNEMIKNQINITTLVDKTENVSFDKMSFNCDPNMILESIASSNSVFLISATAKNKTVLNNFNLKKIGKNINIFNFNIDFLEKINNKINETNKKTEELAETKIINVEKDLNYINVGEINKLLYMFNFSDYEILKYKEYSNVICNFLEKEKTKYLIFFLNKNIKYEIVEKLMGLILKNENKNVEFFPNEKHKVINSDFLNSEYKDDLFKSLNNDANNKIIIFTTMAAVGAGVNIQATNQHMINMENYFLVDDNNKNNKEFDFDSVYIEKRTNIVTETNKVSEQENASSISERSKNYIKLIDIINTLLINDKIDYQSDYIKIFDIISSSSAQINKEVNNLYVNTEDFIYNMSGIIKQIVGRGVRTNVRPKNRNIYLSKDLFYLKNDFLLEEEGDILEITEHKKIIEALNEKNKNIKLSDRFNSAIIRNNNSKLRFSKFKDQTLNMALSGNLKSQKEWDNIRNFLIKNGAIFNIEDLIEFGLEKHTDIFIYNEQKTNNASIKNIKNIYSDLGMDIIKKNKDLRSYFEENEYFLTFKCGHYTINEICYNDILKGVIGERVIKYFWEKIMCMNILDYTNINDKGNIFEVADYFYRNENNLIGIDAKNYQLNKYKSGDYDKNLLFRAGIKIGDKIDKLIIINAFLPKEQKFSIHYGNIDQINGCFVKNERTNKNATVCIINGVFNKDGAVTDIINHIKGIKEWMNEK